MSKSVSEQNAKFTKAELTIAKLRFAGFTAKQIAHILKKDKGEVKSLLSIIIRKIQSVSDSLTLHREMKNIDAKIRYPMTHDQTAQIDCRKTNCLWHNKEGQCINMSPAITLNPNGSFVCWSETEDF